VFLTNHLELPTQTVADLYRCRWHIELFFTGIMQRLRSKALYGCSGNAVKSQISIAIGVYLLIAIACKLLQLGIPLHALLKILNLTLFETTPLPALVVRCQPTCPPQPEPKQLNLFEF
jgi:hypothetical protein